MSIEINGNIPKRGKRTRRGLPALRSAVTEQLPDIPHFHSQIIKQILLINTIVLIKATLPDIAISIYDALGPGADAWVVYRPRGNQEILHQDIDRIHRLDGVMSAATDQRNILQSDILT